MNGSLSKNGMVMISYGVRDLHIKTSDEFYMLISTGSVSEETTKIDIDFGSRALDPNEYGISDCIFDLDVNFIHMDNGNIASIQCKYGGTYMFKDLSGEDLRYAIDVRCASSLFPYFRAFISTLTRDMGMSALILDDVDFESVADEMKKAS